MSIGMIYLPLRLREAPNKATQMTTVMVIDQLPTYNIIIGRPTLNALRVVPFIYHMIMKYLTTKGIWVIKGD